ncbi:MvdC/MvdD family ATP grasp protein [Tengunoibacter tsumagoiensis]|uniref:ATP-grasp ribosomal peptide maturase n=1 Tax=Tengunoibacter tsumagoiensis TaxID=2014871 RepID=A0A402A094_9CHLR|nr:hypothetical protein [Tengunoibacter tsumagoiensis]GCE12533.1 ATP-grasp ribosomal peptide maturase [Tengunoibacter tsumagoiensis]
MRQVLILSRPQDGHVSPVLEEIKARGARAYCLHTADFPEKATFTSILSQAAGGWIGSLISDDQTIPLQELTSIWRRRPKRYVASNAYAPGIKAFIEEAERALLGVLESQTLQGTFWVSQTHAVRRADLKALQLAMARHLGFQVPRTLMTNSPQEAEAFYHQCHGNIILKAVSRGAIENEEQQMSHFLYTSQVERAHFAHIEGVRVTAHLFQERIEKTCDVRIVVIGRQVFAARMHSLQGGQACLDFRQQYANLTYEVHTLPEVIREKVLELVRSFDLQFASMDCLITSQDEYVFLDLNPNGQFLWLQYRLGSRLPLKEAMADLLVYPEEYRL